MKKDITIFSADNQYTHLVSDVLERIKQTHLSTAIGINRQLITLYWSIGKDIEALQAETKWGDGFYFQLSHDLQHACPDNKGFSVRNLQYMAQMYRTFNQVDIITPQPVAQIEKSISATRGLLLCIADYRTWLEQKYVAQHVRYTTLPK